MSARAFLSLFMRVFLLFLFIRFCAMCNCERVEHRAENAEHDGDVREAAAARARQTVHRAVDCCDVEGVTIVFAVYYLAVIRAERLVHLHGERAGV